MLKINFVAETLPQDGVLALTVASEKSLGQHGLKLDKKLGGILSRAMKNSAFTGAREQTLAILVPSKSELDKIILIGIGDTDTIDALASQNIGGALYAALAGGKESHAVFLFDAHEGNEMPVADAAANVAFGARLRSYRFDKYRTTLKPDQKPVKKNLAIAVGNISAARRLWQECEKVVEGVFMTRDLVSEPPNLLYPETMAEECKKLSELGVEVNILNEKSIRALGMGALIGVAQGSVREPRVVSLYWKGDKSSKDQRPVVFVGKGVTFDTGGISLKPPAGMEDMKWDMGGAGAVIGALRAIAGRKAKANVLGLVGLVENMPSGNAQRPSDVVTSLSGQTIEVINTDAEGRLVLADVITYAQQKWSPRCIIDLATLTGAIMIALGREYAGLFANDDALAQNLANAGALVGEKLWRFPLGDVYDRALESPIADMRNVATSRDAGSIVAAQFIKRFVKKDIPWAHLDIAGMAWLGKDKPTCPKGASAYGVQLLNKFISEAIEK